ncbi:Formimidoylglutamase [Rhodanobacter lindaniclasticus]
MMDGWLGRIDSTDDPAAFRWHQVVRPITPNASPGVALIGFTSDEGVRRNGGRIGAAEGPIILRQALANMPVAHDGPLYDAGNEVCSEGNLEHAQRQFAAHVTTLINAGHLPIGLGGGHEIAYASYLGLADSASCRNRRIAIVNLDAHLDLRDSLEATSGTPFLQAIRHAQANGIKLDYLCLGVSASANTRRLLATAEAVGARYWRDEELIPSRLEAVIAEVMNRLSSADAIYLTMCMDVLPEATAPGVSAPSPRGVALDVVEPIVHAIARTGRLRMFDVAELCPRLDPAGATARVAARLIHGVSTYRRNDQDMPQD